jgi:tRNA(adenine34) deaminase
MILSHDFPNLQSDMNLPTREQDEFFMEKALYEAQRAYRQQEVPIGAVIVREGVIIAKGYNQTEILQDPTAHAEMIAITSASEYLGSRRLDDCTLYVTLEPCCMCAGGIVLARVPRIVFAAFDPKAGACGSLYRIPEDTRLNHRCSVVGGVRQEESAAMLKSFFAELRSGIIQRSSRTADTRTLRTSHEQQYPTSHDEFSDIVEW